MRNVVNLAARAALLQDAWSPRIVAQLNDYHLKVARLEGAFVWHSHPETDEAFLVLDGVLRIELRDGELVLASGDLAVIPRGVEHRPVADEVCHVLLMEPAGTVNTGDAGGARTVDPAWI